MNKKYLGQKKWSEAEDNKIIELYEQGLSNSQIADQMNRTYDSISHRIQLLTKTKELNKTRRKKTIKEEYYQNAINLIAGFKARKNKSRHKVAKSTTDINKANYDMILKIDGKNEADELSLNTRANYIAHLKLFAYWLKDKTFKDCNLDIIEEYIRHLQKDSKPATIASHKSNLKFLFTKIQEESPSKDIMKIVAKLGEKKRAKNGDNEAERKEHLSKVEIVKLISGIKGDDIVAKRDRALLAAVYNSGGRIGEVLAVRKNNTHLEGKFPKLFLPISKTKKRDSHLLNFALPYLIEWTKVHEFWNDDEAPLFYSRSVSNYGQTLTAHAVRKILARALRISGIKKHITLHGLRHSKAYHCAVDGMTAAEANALFGWGRSSNMFAYYSSMAKEEIKLRELERTGKLTKEQIEERKQERNAFVSSKCNRCHTTITPDQFVCPKCGLSKNKKVAEIELAKEKKADSEISDLKRQMAQIVASINDLKTLKVEKERRARV